MARPARQPSGGCCASKPAREKKPRAEQSSSLPSLDPAGASSSAAAAAAGTAARPDSVPEPPPSADRAVVAPLHPTVSHELRKSFAKSERLPPTLVRAAVVEAATQPTEEEAWGGLSRKTATHYRIEGAVRRSDGSEHAFSTDCRYSTLHELHSRMGSDMLGVHTPAQRQAVQAGLALFPQKSLVHGAGLVEARRRQLNQWLAHWVQLGHGRSGDGQHSSSYLRNSAVTRCSALLCEYLDTDTSAQDKIEEQLRAQAELQDAEQILPVPRASRHPSKPRRQASPSNGASTGGASASSVALRVAVSGVRSSIGSLRVAVWNSAEGWRQDGGSKTARACFHERYDLQAKGGRWSTTLPALPAVEGGVPVEYACMVFHDLKDGGQLDTNMIGIRAPTLAGDFGWWR